MKNVFFHQIYRCLWDRHVLTLNVPVPHSSVTVFSTLVLIEDTIFASLLGEWTIIAMSLLCPAIIWAAYRSTEQFVRLQGNSTMKPLLIKKPKNHLLPIFSPDFTLNGQIWLVYDEKWFFVKLLGTFAWGQTHSTFAWRHLIFCPWEKKPLHSFLLIQPP